MRGRNENETVYLERAEKAEATLLAFIETADGLAYSLDRNFRYINLNSALKNKLKEVFGIDANPGDKMTGVIKKTDREAMLEWKEIYAKALKGEPARFIKEISTKAKPEFWSFSINPIRQNGVVTGLVCYSHSVNEIQRVRAALKSLRGAFPKNYKHKKTLRGIKPVTSLTLLQASKLESVFEFIFKEWKEELTEKNVQIIIKILELLFEYDSVFPNIQPGQKKARIFNPVIAQFGELIGRHYKKQRTVSFYANALHLHPYYLNALVKRHTGLTAKETILRHIVLEAKSLLASTSLTIKEISFKMGFEHPEHFYSLFKKVEKVSPARYRLAIR